MDFESVDLENHKIKPIILGKKKQSSMTTKQFQEFVIEFIQEQKLVNQRQEETNKKQEKFNQQQLQFNKMVMQGLDNIEKRLDKIESWPTIKKELKFS